MELDQVFGYFWHLQTEIFHVKKNSRKNILFRKSYEQNKLFSERFFKKNENITFFKFLFQNRCWSFKKAYLKNTGRSPCGRYVIIRVRIRIDIMVLQTKMLWQLWYMLRFGYRRYRMPWTVYATLQCLANDKSPR